MDNLVVLVQLEDNKKIIEHIEKLKKEGQFNIDNPINSVK